ncbi:MAG: 2-amino-4-hydroxy-6-hydroxymethyldihydropteridine diphosphokinase [Coriobacteriia bacterium]|nr:2-amino-4-hydroxy-6-hydroxymethyldihydropteridine diphosphokinase [Coriobacteriia bacterium]
MTRAYIGLGANLGERIHTLADALCAIDALPETTVAAVSRVYESESWPDPTSPAYANAVAVVETALEADVLLRLMKEIETDLGRTPGPRNAPRVVDLDIVLFGDEEWEGTELVIPHPRFAEREFVVRPLLEVDPLVTLPDGSPVCDDRVSVGRITGALGTLPGFADLTRGPGDKEPSEEWVEVAEGGAAPGSGQASATDALLLLERSVLEQEGIPYAWDPYAPELWTNPWGFKPRFRLMVPGEHADRARRLLRVVVSAPSAPESYPDGGDETE